MAELLARKLILKEGRAIELRSARASDAEAILNYVRKILKEDIYALTTLEEFQMTLEKETEWIENHLASPSRIVLLVLHEGAIIGLLNFANGMKNRNAHTGEFGMSVAREFRGCGVGSALLGGLIDWARGTGLIEKINLQTHATNEPAQALYRKFGFDIEGVKRRDLKYGPGEYIDSFLMGRLIG